MTAVHRHLEGDGPPTVAQIAEWMCREWGCSPTEAVNEIRHNPELGEIIFASAYRRAWLALRDWDDTPNDQREEKDAPSGEIVDLVLAERQRYLEAKAARRSAELEKRNRT